MFFRALFRDSGSQHQKPRQHIWAWSWAMPSSRKVLAKFNTQGKYILGTEYFRLTIESYIPGIISNQYKVTWSERTYETKKKKKLSLIRLGWTNGIRSMSFHSCFRTSLSLKYLHTPGIACLKMSELKISVNLVHWEHRVRQKLIKQQCINYCVCLHLELKYKIITHDSSKKESGP